MAKKIQIELVASTIATPQWMRRIAQALALKKINDKVIVPDNGAMRGMARKIPHLVRVTEVKE